MNRIPMLTLLLCALAVSGYAATLSGTVTNTTTSTPVSGQKVYVSDTLGTWTDSTITDVSGAYSFTFPSSLSVGAPLSARTAGCGGYTSWWHAAYSGSNMTANFTTCTYALQGTVSLSGAANGGQAMLYLIREFNDTLAGVHTLTAIDSFLSAPTGGGFYKVYPVIPGGKLLLKAALRPSHPSYASYLPTYYSSSAVWSSAATLSLTNFTAATNINMLGGTNPGGPGFIGGNVLLGANKTAGVGDPLSGRIIVLANAADKPVAYAYSDAKGHFEFRNIAVGSYKLYGDAWGKTNPPLQVSLTGTAPNVSSIIFEENSSSFAGRLVGVGVERPAALASLNVYPNPVTSFVQIDGLAAVKGDKTVTVLGMNGAVISTQTTSAASLRIATESLPAGVYILQVATGAGTASFQLVK